MSHSHGQMQTIQIADWKKAPPFMKSTAEYLMDGKKSGLKLRQGVFNGKRVDYFKGKSAVSALLKDGYAKMLSKSKQDALSNREDAIKVMNELGKNGFILRVNRGDALGGKGSPRVLQPNSAQEMQEDGYYMWIYEGSQIKLYAGAAMLVAVVLAAVLFPLWPETLRLGVWYLSVGVLGLLGVFFGIAIVRLILYIISIIVLPRGIWIFPNLFEDVGIIESFIPLWGWDEPKSKKPAAVTSNTEQSVTDTTTTPSAEKVTTNKDD
ncbi:hypothetical protein LRAMOSA11014 [Lichtheimia ramosa]|uniref:Translocation protein SEC62 n=1 Tax=Lichtheimia ramosa TaxID=688394 RepID=A0A077WR51_9FUNG|nr:hypothetical protein LRAMOSA11014 [Lichtheimia ramosa]